jgi:hypothetical protein
MALGPEERERQLDDLRKEIGGRLNTDDDFFNFDILERWIVMHLNLLNADKLNLYSL